MDEEEIAEFFHNSCISQHILLPGVLNYFFYVLLRCHGQGTGRCMHTEAKTGGILGQKTQVHRIQHLMGWIKHSLIEVEWKSQLVFSLKYLGIYVSCESHWALIYYLRRVWVLNKEVDFNLDLNWGLRSNLTHRFFIQYLAGCKCSLAVIFLPGTYFGTRAALAGALERWPTWSQAAIGIKVSASSSDFCNM